MNIVSVISAKMDDLGRLVTKFLRNGKDDIQETKTALPFGFDCMPVKDIKGVYSPTANMAEPVLIGFINEKLVSEIGESGMYSTNSDGEIQIYLRLKNDGTIHFGGDAGHLTRYEELKEGFDTLKDDFNSFVSTYNSHIHITTATIGASATPGVIAPTTSTGTPTSADISGAKIDELKTL